MLYGMEALYCFERQNNIIIFFLLKKIRSAYSPALFLLLYVLIPFHNSTERPNKFPLELLIIKIEKKMIAVLNII